MRRSPSVSAARFALLAVASLSIVMLARLQGHMIYFPTRELEVTPERIGLAYESVTMPTEDGVRIHGWWIPSRPVAPAASRPGAGTARATVLFFHGNAGNISHRLDTIAILHRLGLDTLIIDYRGYGQSEGTPDEDGTYADARAALRHLTDDRAVDRSKLVYFGRSLGGGVATKLAVEQPPAALILESTFTSVPELAAELYPLPLVRELTRIRYPNLERIREIDAPLLVVHSRDDELIPVAMGRKLFEAADEPKAFLEIGGSHGDGFYLSGERYIEGLDAFLTGVFGPRT